MSALFTRAGREITSGIVREGGRPFYSRRERCRRCGGAGGSEAWRYTGFTCYECAGSGLGPVRIDRLYTKDELARLNAATAKRAEKRAAKAAAAEEARRAPYLEWRRANEHLLSQIGAHAPGDLVQRIEADAGRFVIPPAWLLDVAIAAILRTSMIADQKAASHYVGEIGKRIEITLECERLIDLSDPNGWPRRYFYIALMRDDAGNRVVYKGGNPPLGKGETGRFRVTIKDHETRDGEQQTIVARPVAIEDTRRPFGELRRAA